jgi:3-hydroxyisobutyrate dehydrogenase
METVAILGLGTMGMGMAKNLLKAGFTVHAYNRTRAKAEPLEAEGAYIHDTPADAACNADIVIAMLSDDNASRAAWTGSQGVLIAAKAGALLIDSSTITPAWAEELGGLAKARNLEFLDAPVTGSRAQAEGKQLSFLVGGDSKTFQRALPAFEAMGQSAIHFGPVGSGARMKLINNFLCGVQVASLAEAVVWIERSGLNREQALEFLKQAAPGSPLLRGVAGRMVEATYGVNFFLSLMKKDMNYAQADAKTLGVELKTASTAEARFQDAVRAGFGEKDMSAVVEPLRRQYRGREEVGAGRVEPPCRSPDVDD